MISRRKRRKKMSEISFKAFGVFCFSVICFGLGTGIAGALLSFGDGDSMFFVAWLVGTVVFGIAMVVASG
jgi:hypothetical protein